jgi:single-strand DNA-binding protein
MSANNCIVVIGRVGKDPELRQAGQNPVASFSLAVDRSGRKDRDGNKITDWFQVSLWGRQAELAQQLITKGQQVSVVGSCWIDEWQDQQGVRQRMVKVNADGFQLCGSRADNEARDGGQPQSYGAPPQAQSYGAPPPRQAPPPPAPAIPPGDDYAEDDIPPF